MKEKMCCRIDPSSSENLGSYSLDPESKRILIEELEKKGQIKYFQDLRDPYLRSLVRGVKIKDR